MYRLGFIGFGNIAQSHLRALQAVPEAVVIAVADTSQKQLEAADAQGLKSYIDWEAMLQNETLDGILICSPPVAHFAQASSAMRRGMHVFLEKPMTVSVEEAKQLVGLADQLDRHLVVGFAHRFHVPLRWAREQIAQGAIGRIMMFRNRFSSLFIGVDQRWFSRQRDAGGGVVMDTAVHSIDLFRYLVGEINEVTGVQTHLYAKKLEVEDTAIITLRGENGSLGSIEVSWAIPDGEASVAIYGEKGVIRYNYGREAICRLYGSQDSICSPPQDGRNFVHQMQHFISVLGGAAPIVTGRDGLRAAQVIDEFYAKSASDAIA